MKKRGENLNAEDGKKLEEERPTLKLTSGAAFAAQYNGYALPTAHAVGNATRCRRIHGYEGCSDNREAVAACSPRREPWVMRNLILSREGGARSLLERASEAAIIVKKC